MITTTIIIYISLMDSAYARAIRPSGYPLGLLEGEFGQGLLRA
jgi:hypothetical protein